MACHLLPSDVMPAAKQRRLASGRMREVDFEGPTELESAAK